MDDDKKSRGRICVTGGTGFLGSWVVKRLLEDGYSVNMTTRIDPERKRDISYLTKLPGASTRLQIFNADLDKPESFVAAIRGCDGVFHTAHPINLDEKESEETTIKGVIKGTLGLLRACVESKTVRRVVYTSSISTAMFNGSKLIDENTWTNVDYVRRLAAVMGPVQVPYVVAKTLGEKTAIDFAEKHGLDLVTVLPTVITGPFICPHVPDSVDLSIALILGDEKCYGVLKSTSMVHVDDVARAHIHLFEHPNAKGRYLCTGVLTSIEEISDFIAGRYPEYKLPTADSWKDLKPSKMSGISSKKLMETGFKYENGLAEMLDGAIKCRKPRSRL